VRRLYALVPLPLVVLLATWGSARVADRAGSVMAGLFGVVAGFLTVPPAPPEDPDLVPTSGNLAEEASPPAPPSTKKTQRAKRTAPTKVLFVSAETVLKIAATKVHLRGVPVAREGARPAGLRLVGVSALGVGLADGDVLTKALGQPVMSRSEVVRAVLGARARQEKVLEGEFYRGSERWILRVEQPYPSEPRALLQSPRSGGVDSG
jgi:S1-C subfamily serine protease